MKILCVGFWKTGTKSMTQALRLLGYKVHDFDEQLTEFKALWSMFFNGTITDDDIRETLKDVEVLIDGPTILFWNEIYRVFPDAKVIFTTRDEDGWWKSFYKMNRKLYEIPLLRYALLLSPTGFSLSLFVQKSFTFAYGLNDFSPLSFDWQGNERLYKLKFRMHNSHVLQTVPSDVLLKHNSADGWEPLCKYLGKETPSIPYPHKNKNANLLQGELKEHKLFMRILY